MAFEISEAYLPEGAIALDPRDDLRQRFRLNLVESLAAARVSETSRASRSTRKCFEIAGRLCSNAPARLFTGVGPARSPSRIARRVGSAMARKTSAAGWARERSI
jgi:hypothetical protein